MTEFPTPEDVLRQARRQAFIAGLLTENEDLTARQVEEAADEYLRHSEDGS